PEQVNAIQQLMSDERRNLEPLMAQMRATKTKLLAATAGRQTNEKEIKTLADALGRHAYETDSCQFPHAGANLRTPEWGSTKKSWTPSNSLASPELRHGLKLIPREDVFARSASPPLQWHSQHFQPTTSVGRLPCISSIPHRSVLPDSAPRAV